jgi:hypothetical protein
VTGIDVAVPDRKSDTAQKNVTVWLTLAKVSRQPKGEGPTHCERNIKVIILRAELVERIDQVEEA